MRSHTTADAITDITALEEVYGPFPKEGRLKESPVITPAAQTWIESSPFVLLATIGEEGMDCSPRGDPAPVAHVIDPHTLHLPDRRGNNRLDSLRNIVLDPRVALLFLVPGINVTVRVNGAAKLRTDDALLARYAERGNRPATVIEVEVQTVYAQCPRALVRSQLWVTEGLRRADELPTMGELLAEAVALNNASGFDAAQFDADQEKRLPDTLY